MQIKTNLTILIALSIISFTFAFGTFTLPVTDALGIGIDGVFMNDASKKVYIFKGMNL